jgi:hypothetical protein
MYTSSLQTRKCLFCAQPLSGRADKKFCTGSCKAHYSRATSQPAATLFTSPPPTIPSDELEELLETKAPWDVLTGVNLEGKKYLGYYRAVRSYQDGNDPLHYLYADVVEEFISELFIIDDRTLEEHDSFTQKVAEATYKYARHPNLQLPNHIAHRRLFSLYLVHDYLHETRRNIIADIGPLLAKLGTELVICFDWSNVPPKHYKYLWRNLFPETSSVPVL